MIQTGSAPYPVERTMLVSGMLESCLASKIQGGRTIETPISTLLSFVANVVSILPDLRDRQARFSQHGNLLFPSWCAFAKNTWCYSPLPPVLDLRQIDLTRRIGDLG